MRGGAAAPTGTGLGTNHTPDPVTPGTDLTQLDPAPVVSADPDSQAPTGVGLSTQAAGGVQCRPRTFH